MALLGGVQTPAMLCPSCGARGEDDAVFCPACGRAFGGVPPSGNLLSSVPAAPRTPSDQAKRLVLGFGSAQLVFLMVGGIFVAVGGFITAVFLLVKAPLPAIIIPLVFPTIGAVLMSFPIRGRLRRIQAFKTGTATVATVDSFGPDLSTRINGRHPTQLRWTFQVGNSSYIGSLSNMDQSLLTPLAQDGQVVVLYDPQDPSINTAWLP